jgi:hypothetical protein
MITHRRALAFLLPFLALPLAATTIALGQAPKAATAAADNPLATLRAGHPRIFLAPGDWVRLESLIKTDDLAASWFKALEKDARAILREKPVEHVLIGPRLLDKSRKALQRIAILAAVYRLNGDKALRDRAVLEMKTVSAFPDWNPSHFLDTAEMTTAVAIGYDWLFDELAPADRETFKNAIVTLGLKPGLKVYESKKGWPKSPANWNQVCNGGMTVGALAIADLEPDLARTIVAAGRASIPTAMASFAPDGGWAEGPGYWGYATMYNVFYLNAIECALGTDFGLKAMPGVSVTHRFRMDFVGPTNQTFNFADAHTGPGSTPQMIWFGRAFNHAEAVRWEVERTGDRPNIFHLLYLPGAPRTTTAAAPALDSIYRGIDVAFLASAPPGDKNALWVGLKGGDNAANHSHLDLGTFVLDAQGLRWASDLGSDDYNLPSYFGYKRWTYYRLRSEGHNVVTLGTDNQEPKAKAPLIAFSDDPKMSFAVADLTAAYGDRVKAATRGIAMIDRKAVLVQDEITPAAAEELLWGTHTYARITLDGATATLSQSGKTMTARLLEPAGATFEVLSANPPRPQGQQPKVSKLAVRVPKAPASTSTRIAVLFTPGEKPGPAPAVLPLSTWVERGALRPLPKK